MTRTVKRKIGKRGMEWHKGKKNGRKPSVELEINRVWRPLPPCDLLKP